MARNKSMRFMNNQFAILGATTFSSDQLSIYPFTNLFNNRRSKFWSPNGYFGVDDTNNKIYVNGSEGTLTNGTYTGATLATEIETQLNAISSGWTVAYNSSVYRFELTNAAVHTINFTTTTNAVWDSIGFLTVSDLATPGTVSSDEPRIHTEEFLKVDLGIALEPGFVGLVGPINEVFSVSEDAVITIEASNVDDFVTPELSLPITRTDSGILEHIDSDTEDRAYRYWKLKIVDRKNTATGPQGFKFSYFYLGDYKTFTATNLTRGFTKEIQDPSRSFTSESGQEFFLEKQKYHTYKSMSVEVLRGTEREEMEQLFYDFGVTQPLFVSLDPLNNISLANDEHTKLMRFDSKPSFKHTFLDYYNVSLSLKEVI